MKSARSQTRRIAIGLSATALLMVSVSACSLSIGTDGHGSSHMSSGSMMNDDDESSNSSNSATAAINMSDVMFAQMMIPHHEQAVDMSALAPAAGASPEVQQLAKQIAAAQGPEIEQMKAMLDRWGVNEMMDHSGHQMAGMVSDDDMNRLRSAKGTEFDRLYLTFMIEHHEGAIDMTRDPLKNGADPELRTLLEAIVTTQTGEIAEMKQMLATLPA